MATPGELEGLLARLDERLSLLWRLEEELLQTLQPLAQGRETCALALARAEVAQLEAGLQEARAEELLRRLLAEAADETERFKTGPPVGDGQARDGLQAAWEATDKTRRALDEALSGRASATRSSGRNGSGSASKGWGRSGQSGKGGPKRPTRRAMSGTASRTPCTSSSILKRGRLPGLPRLARLAADDIPKLVAGELHDIAGHAIRGHVPDPIPGAPLGVCVNRPRALGGQPREPLGGA